MEWLTRLDKYILRQLATPLIFAVTVITSIVWLTQSLQRLELVVESGQGWGGFFWLTLLLVPSLLIVVVPFAVFGAALFMLQRLHADSEIAVLFAAGVSKLRLALPVLFVAFLGAIATLWISIDLMPRSYRILKQEVANIRADFASLVLRDGEFTPFGEGFTIYIEETLSDGAFRGLLINDYRKPDEIQTYMAQFGRMRDTEEGPVLFLSNGNIQKSTTDEQSVDIINFSRTAINVGSYNMKTDEIQLELTERYLSELLRPDMSNKWDRENVGKLAAEGHARLASPFYPIAYTLIALYALIGGEYSRRGYSFRIAAACLSAAGLRILAFLVQSAAAENGAYWALYLLPILPTVVIFALLADIPSPFSLPKTTQITASV